MELKTDSDECLFVKQLLSFSVQELSNVLMDRTNAGGIRHRVIGPMILCEHNKPRQPEVAPII